MSLWPQDQDLSIEEHEDGDDKPNDWWREGGHEMHEVWEELSVHGDSGRVSVGGVLRTHLAAFERGFVTLGEASTAFSRWNGESWLFQAGDVVEWRGGDLRWRLGVVVSSTQHLHSVYSASGVLTAFDEFDPDAPTPRPSNKVLRVVFGPTPFRWQQYTLLKAEERMVHRRGSPHDFQNVQWYQWAEQRWKEWVSSGDFGVFYSEQPQGAQRALAALVLEPFRLIDEINTWDVDHSRLTPYMYCACLGSGTPVALVCLAIQLGLAICLSLFDHSTRNEFADSVSLFPCRPNSDRGPLLGNVMIALITSFYFFKVVPSLLSAVMSAVSWRHTRLSAVAGRVAVSGADKIAALRRQLRASDEDTLPMIFGLRLHETMNTAFDAGLYLLNLYILFGTNSVLEILLNCVAVEWVRSIDESFCAAPWWDPSSRYIKAAAIEMVLRKFLDLRSLEARRAACSRRAKSPPAESSIRTRRQSSSRALASAFVAAKLDVELDRFYGDDLQGASAPRRFWGLNQGLNSAMFGGYKGRVFRRWTLFLDGTIDWAAEIADFDRPAHVARARREARSIHLVYGALPGFPRTFLTPHARYAIASFLHKHPATANIILIALGFKLYRAITYRNPETGFHSESSHLRHAATVLYTTVELASMWIVVAFPGIVLTFLFYFPVCY